MLNNIASRDKRERSSPAKQSRRNKRQLSDSEETDVSGKSSEVGEAGFQKARSEADGEPRPMKITSSWTQKRHKQSEKFGGEKNQGC